MKKPAAVAAGFLFCWFSQGPHRSTKESAVALGRRRWISLAVLLLFFSPLLTRTTLAAQITVEPNQGPAGTKVTVKGTEWPAGDLIEFSWDFNWSVTVASVRAAGNGTFSAAVTVPSGAPIGTTYVDAGDQAAFLTAQAPFTVVAQSSKCADAYLVGVHGIAEGPDLNGQGSSPTIKATWETFDKLAKQNGYRVQEHFLRYPIAKWADLDVIKNIADLIDAQNNGVLELNKFVRVLLKACKYTPKIVLVGYSLGAWIINDWLSADEKEGGGKDLWNSISAVELYGDPLWYRFGPAYPAAPPKEYKGLASHVMDLSWSPYNKNPQGPGGELSKRWQSRCLVGDPICGEGYSGWDALAKQIDKAVNCDKSPTKCEHEKYSGRLTTAGANFLALKTLQKKTVKLEIVQYETSVEGDHVYIRLYYTGSPTGFGFVGANGSGWGFEERPFSEYPWARVVPVDKAGTGRVDHPFNHLCSTQPHNASDIEAWVYRDGASPRESAHVKIHLACSAPKDVITPFFAQ